jgi:hypothetical protein
MRIDELHDELCTGFIDAGATPVEQLLPLRYNGKKADVVFVPERVIVEVKSLFDDSLESKRVRTNFDRIVLEWMKKGGPIIFGKVNLNLSDLPPAMAKEMISYVGERVKTGLKDSSRQIRATGAMLNWDHFYGITAFASPAHFKTHPGVIARAAWDLLRRPQLAPLLNGVMTFWVPVDDHPGQLMIIPHPRGVRSIPDSIYERMGRGFAARFAAREGMQLTHQIADEDEFMGRFMGPEYD